MIQNPFEGRDEVMFVSYHDIINLTRYGIYDLIRKGELYEEYKEFINIDIIKNMDEKNLIRYTLQSEFNNPMYDLLLEELVDYEENEIPDDSTEARLSEMIEFTIRNSDVDFYNHTPKGSFASAINILCTQKFMKHIYIYTDEYDARIHAQLSNLYIDKNSEKVTYVYGDFKEAIEKINTSNKITCYLLNDIYYLDELLSMDKKFYEYTEISLCKLGINYTYDEFSNEMDLNTHYDDKFFDSKLIKFGMFDPFPLSAENFTNIDYIDTIVKGIGEELKGTEKELTENEIEELKTAMVQYSEEVKKVKGDPELIVKMDDGEVINYNKGIPKY